jgi:hypothetical protein
MYCRVLNWMSTDVSEVCAASIIRAMMEAAHTSEMSVDILLRTCQYIPEDSELHTRSCENLKSQMCNEFLSHKLCKLFVCLMYFQIFCVCKNHLLPFMLFLLGPFIRVKEGFYCITVYLWLYCWFTLAFHNHILVSPLITYNVVTVIHCDEGSIQDGSLFDKNIN